MKIIIVTLLVVLLVNTHTSKAETIDCIIIKKEDKVLIQEGKNCNTPYSPNSTFKIPLAVMGFESGILKTAHNPIWKPQKPVTFLKYYHDGEQSPSSWMRWSMPWYSQILTQKMGIKKFQDYINKLDYGNKDLSGDKGKNNGLTDSWLSSSLKITPLQQIDFIEKLAKKKLGMEEKLTFIFDFDATMYNTKPENDQKNIVGKKHRSYVDMLYESVLKDSRYERNEVENWVSKNIHIANSPEGVNEFMRRLDNKFHIKIQQKDINYTVSELNKVQTKGLKEIILKLKSQGHQVLIVGGGTWGCSIIPEFARQFGIEKSDIYSGYFKDFSDSEMARTLFDKYRYTNCENLDLQTPISEIKSDVIKFLKKEKIIKGKVIHIGDGENDLEVWQNGEAYKFIGFGVNRYSKKVENGSKIYVKTIDEFRNEIGNIINQQSFTKQSQIKTIDLIKLMEAGSWHGWNLHGKTGASDFDKINVVEGYFVGFAEKNGQIISYVIHVSGDIGDKKAKTGGLQAKKILLDRMLKDEIFNN